jgi:hypothetical protein
MNRIGRQYRDKAINRSHLPEAFMQNRTAVFGGILILLMTFIAVSDLISACMTRLNRIWETGYYLLLLSILWEQIIWEDAFFQELSLGQDTLLE